MPLPGEDEMEKSGTRKAERNNSSEQEKPSSSEPPGVIDWVLNNYDAETTESPNIDTELSRLQVLKSFHLLDQRSDDCYNRLASVAGRIFSAPLALINLVDLGRIWQVAGYGLSSFKDLNRDMPRVTSLCAHTILQKELLLVVPDLLKDSRFRSSPWANCGIRFYAGTPLVSPEGAHIGTLCVLDSKPREGPFGEDQQEQLMDLAASIMDLMAEKRQSLSSTEPDYPGFTFSYDVQRAATFLRQQLSRLKDDSDFQTVAGDAHRDALQSAYDSADFLYASLVPNQRCSQTRLSKTKHQNRESESMPPPSQRESSGSGAPKVGEQKAIDLAAFVKSLEIAMEAFPRKVHLSFSLHPGLPGELWFNDLKVFRSAIALLTSACERTNDGFVRLKIFSRHEREEGQVVVFECEDTGRDVDLDRFESLFHPPPGGIDVGYENCIWLNDSTGKIERSVSCEEPTAPVSGGFAVHPVAEYVASMGGKYGFRPRFVEAGHGDGGSGSIFWFSIPLREATSTPQSGTSLSVLDSAIDSALEMSSPVANASNQDIQRVDASAARPWF